jgi:hypothetical protein
MYRVRLFALLVDITLSVSVTVESSVDPVVGGLASRMMCRCRYQPKTTRQSSNWIWFHFFIADGRLTYHDYGHVLRAYPVIQARTKFWHAIL